MREYRLPNPEFELVEQVGDEDGEHIEEKPVESDGECALRHAREDLGLIKMQV